MGLMDSPGTLPLPPAYSPLPPGRKAAILGQFPALRGGSVRGYHPSGVDGWSRGESPAGPEDVTVKRFAPACLGLVLLASCGTVDLSNLDDKPNVGPCPVSASLYEASRVVEINGTERHENVAFTGAI